MNTIMKAFGILTALLLCHTTFGQHKFHIPCGHDHYVNALEKDNPGFRKAYQNAFEVAKNTVSTRDDELLPIPVVVHVVYKEEEVNLSDERIAAVIQSLNNDYQMLNADADILRNEFSDVAGNPNIQFVHIETVRVKTDSTFELTLTSTELPDQVKLASEGGSDAWDPDQYLNIWVCDIEVDPLIGALFGYAYPPADLDNWPADVSAPTKAQDGVVIHYEAFTTEGEFSIASPTGGVISTNLRGRTVTHEVGHYLGLRHIWGDGQLSTFGIADCDVDDGIEDTPNQGLPSQFECDDTQNSCVDPAADLPDMYENYMDYADEACMVAFTKEQAALMRNVLMNNRPGLINNPVSVKDPGHIQSSIYPNPTNNNVTIAVSNGNDFNLSISDMNGINIHNSAYQGTANISTQDWSRGIYLVQIRQGENVSVKKLVVMK